MRKMHGVLLLLAMLCAILPRAVHTAVDTLHTGATLLDFMTLNSSSRNFVYSSAVDTHDGGVVVGGSFEGTLQLNDSTILSSVAPAAFLVKFSSSRQVVWAMQGVNVGSSSLVGSLVAEIGVDAGKRELVAVGTFASAEISFDRQTLRRAAKECMAFVLSVSMDSGALTWARSFEGAECVSAKSVSLRVGGDAQQERAIAISGLYRGSAQLDGFVLSDPKQQTFKNEVEGFAALLAENGTVLWAVALRGQGRDVVSSVSVHGDHVLLLASVRPPAVLALGEKKKAVSDADDASIIMRFWPSPEHREQTRVQVVAVVLSASALGSGTLDKAVTFSKTVRSASSSSGGGGGSDGDASGGIGGALSDSGGITCEDTHRIRAGASDGPSTLKSVVVAGCFSGTVIVSPPPPAPPSPPPNDASALLDVDATGSGSSNLQVVVNSRTNYNSIYVIEMSVQSPEATSATLAQAPGSGVACGRAAIGGVMWWSSITSYLLSDYQFALTVDSGVVLLVTYQQGIVSVRSGGSVIGSAGDSVVRQQTQSPGGTGSSVLVTYELGTTSATGVTVSQLASGRLQVTSVHRRAEAATTAVASAEIDDSQLLLTGSYSGEVAFGALGDSRARNSTASSVDAFLARFNTETTTQSAPAMTTGVGALPAAVYAWMLLLIVVVVFSLLLWMSSNRVRGRRNE